MVGSTNPEFVLRPRPHGLRDTREFKKLLQRRQRERHKTTGEKQIWLAICSKIQEHNIFIQGFIFIFNNYSNIHSTSTPYIFIQHKYSFNFNSNYFHSTQIFIQLQHHIFSFNTNIHSTSTKKYPFNFLQVPGHSKFPFNKTARPHPYHIEFCAHHVI